MPTYQITGPDGKKYKVSGENPEGALEALKKHVGGSEPAYDVPYGFGMNWADAATGGLAGKASSAVNAAIRAPFTDKTFGEEYEDIHGSVKAARDRYNEESPVMSATSNIGGGVIGASKLMDAVGGVASKIAPHIAAKMQGGIVGKTITDALGGAGFGAVSGYGYDEDILKNAAIGGGVGLVARPVLAAGGAVLNSAAGLAGIGNKSRADKGIAAALERSGRSAQDITDDLARAANDGQPEFMVADAMGNSGQRMLSGVARSPGDMRQTISETLQARQAGQGERLVNALSEGFDSPRTAAQTAKALTKARTADAARNYGAARGSAGTVDPTGAIKAADDFLGTGGSISRTNIADDSVEATVRRARGMLTDGDNIVSDFDTAFRTKIELDNMIDGAKPIVQQKLIPIRNALDDSLSAASDDYAGARDTFRQQSKVIEAVDTGADAASARMRADDTIPAFRGLEVDEQQAFRTGYSDPFIGRVEAASVSPTTNKARMLQTGKTAQEFPAFAAPGKSGQLMDRIGREQRMFETANTALGGSKTADNLADSADMGGFDPSVIGNALTGNLKTAALQALTASSNALQGRNTQTRDLIAKALMETAPTRANETLLRAVKRGDSSEKLRRAIARALIGGSVAESVR